ncbi:MAG: n-acetylglutamate synthase [Alphaproteobacteria bacterium]|nr:n-acetylglutamate synthase [Alphaproteobacteria bacterium]
MAKVNYDRRMFRALANSAGGQVSADTLFHYRQAGDLVVGVYEGGGIHHGQIIARVDEDGGLDMRYQHVTAAGELMTGTCRTRPEILPDGRLRLHERWRWTCGDGAEGTSILEEIRPPADPETGEA